MNKPPLTGKQTLGEYARKLRTLSDSDFEKEAALSHNPFGDAEIEKERNRRLQMRSLKWARIAGIAAVIGAIAAIGAVVATLEAAGH